MSSINDKHIVIIGAGVAGLAFANQVITHNPKQRITIIEKDNTIGGCHKVARQKLENEYYFTEHGPRVYLSNYVNFIKLLSSMNLKFNDLFIKYRYSLFDISSKLIFVDNVFSITELLILTRDFIFTIFSNTYGSNISMLDYMKYNEFSPNAIKNVDNICRSFDGGDSSRISLNQFISVTIQSLLYNIYIPRVPNDEGLFKLWEQYLKYKGVSFIINNGVTSIIKKKDNNYEIEKIILNDGTEIKGDIFILALPPTQIKTILDNSNDDIKNAFGDLTIFNQFTEKTKYNEYISLTFHWDYDLKLDNDIFGLNTQTEWELLIMVLSNYMKFKESKSKTVISIGIILTDVKNTYLNKTANECNKDELMRSVYEQLRTVYKNIPKPTTYFINNYYDSSTKKWISNEQAFIKVPNIDYIQYKSNKFKNLYNLGTHNGKHKNSFTSVESAISNSIKLSNIICNKKTKIRRCFDIRDLTIVIISIIILLLLIKYTFYGHSSKSSIRS
jgi:protoporphyrinogen oxidase